MAPVEVETKRQVWLNQSSKNEFFSEQHKSHLANGVQTTRYNGLAAIPKLIVEAFSDIANVYFTFVVILMAIPQLPTPPYVTTLIPLCLILLMGWVMDLWDDFRRRIADRALNRQIVKKLVGTKWTSTHWEDVHVGDIVQIDQDEGIPGDVLVLDTSLASGFCFVESKDLDGETNLKRRKALTKHLNLNEGKLSTMDGQVECDAPNIDLLNFNGTFKGSDISQMSFTEEHVLLRGCSLRNTTYVRGVVVYAGSDTKQMKNCGKPRQKRTTLEKKTSILLVQLAALMSFLAVISAVANSVWLKSRPLDRRGMKFLQAYGGLGLDKDKDFNANQNSFEMFWTYFALYANLVPITLIVSVKTVRLLQSFFITFDVEMYHEETDCAPEAKSSNLTDQLGQIEYLLTDKTGTLTSNMMKFKKCTIGGTAYHPCDTGVGGWVGAELEAKIKSNAEDVLDFFSHMATCHTVEVEKKNDDLNYQAESPDEKCLVEAARDTGLVFVGEEIDEHGITLRNVIFPNGESKQYKMFHVIKFDSTRKRMSVVVETPDSKIFVYTKGADNIMEALLDEKSLDVWKKDSQHLTDWSREGLRTLVFAQRELSREEYQQFVDAVQASSQSDEPVKALHAAQALVEQNLSLVGCSAIEDKLQDDVPDTIAKLKEAGIKVWVLTGDKQETAIQIGMSCKLLMNEQQMCRHIVNGNNHEEIRKALIQAKQAIHVDVDHHGKEHGLVIDGPTLLLLLTDDKEKEVGHEQEHCMELFLEVTTLCTAVICCRVTPLQKAMIVKMVKATGKVTMAIGDGANDVSMIRAADIGVGISGLEGRQAVQASDYSIGQFRFLQRLLLVHGRWSYYRMTLFLKYFMYKNFVWNMVVFWHGFNSGNSGTLIFEPIIVTVFNVLYTLLPPMVVGVLDQDVSAEASIKYPMLYKAGIHNVFFTDSIFRYAVLRGIVHSMIIYVFVGLVMYTGLDVSSDGLGQADFQTVGFMFAAICVLIVNVEIGMQMKNWQWMSWLSILFGILSFLLTMGVLHNWHHISGTDPDGECMLCFVSSNYGVFDHVLERGQFYLTVVIVTALCLLPDHLFALVMVDRFPTPTDCVRKMCVKGTGASGSAQQHASPTSSPINTRDRTASYQGSLDETAKKQRSDTNDDNGTSISSGSPSVDELDIRSSSSKSTPTKTKTAMLQQSHI